MILDISNETEGNKLTKSGSIYGNSVWFVSHLTNLSLWFQFERVESRDNWRQKLKARQNMMDNADGDELPYPERNKI